MSAVSVVGEQWIQNRSRNRGTALTWGLLAGFGGLGLAGCVAAAIEQPGLLLFAAIFAAFGYGCFRYARGALRAAMLVGPDEVVVRNPLKTFRLPRSDVERFAAGGQDYGVANPVPGIVVIGRDGSKTRVWTLAREGLVWHQAKNIRRWEETADELNALLAESGSSTTGNPLPSHSTDEPVADPRQTDKALRTARLLTTGSYLILLALCFSAERTAGTVIVGALGVILAIGGYAAIEKIRRDTQRQGADAITGQVPGPQLPLDTTTQIAFAAQVLVAAGIFLILH